MKFVLATLMAIFFTACATQNTQNLSNTPNLLNTRDSTRGIESNSILGLGLYGFQNTLGVACLETDSNEACENLLQSACDEGDFKYCTILGIIYSSGLNESLDDKEREAKASALFKKACDGKNGSGCIALGAFYEDVHTDDFESKLATATYTRLACEYGDYAGCMDIVRGNEEIFKELKDSLELYGAYSEVESKAIYAMAKDTAKSALWGYERLVLLLQKECDNAKKRIEVAKEAAKTLRAKLLGEYREGHIDFDTFAMRRDKLQEKTKYEEFFRDGYCESYKQVKGDKARLEKALRGFDDFGGIGSVRSYKWRDL